MLLEEQLGTHKQKDKPWSKPHTLRKNYLKINQNLECKTQLLGKKRRFLGPRSRQRDQKYDSQNEDGSEMFSKLRPVAQ